MKGSDLSVLEMMDGATAADSAKKNNNTACICTDRPRAEKSNRQPQRNVRERASESEVAVELRSAGGDSSPAACRPLAVASHTKMWSVKRQRRLIMPVRQAAELIPWVCMRMRGGALLLCLQKFIFIITIHDTRRSILLDSSIKSTIKATIHDQTPFKTISPRCRQTTTTRPTRSTRHPHHTAVP
jgi:hypothetical protein